MDSGQESSDSRLALLFRFTTSSSAKEVMPMVNLMKGEPEDGKNYHNVQSKGFTGNH